jgi:hypothetical protein
MLEKNLDKGLRPKLEKEGAYVFKVHGTGSSKAGVPDWHVDHRFYAGWVELKVGREGLSPKQLSEAKKIMRAGGLFVVLRGVERSVEVEDERGNLLGVIKVKGDDSLTICEQLSFHARNVRAGFLAHDQVAFATTP